MASSELVKESHVQEFRKLVSHAEYVNVGNARHMMAGNRNDHFSAAGLFFIGRVGGQGSPSTRKAGVWRGFVSIGKLLQRVRSGCRMIVNPQGAANAAHCGLA
jgi:hypothetical protein